MKILGISCYYHDAAACIVDDGVIVAAAQEERFSRVRHDERFPAQAIRYCMAEAGVDRLDAVAFYETLGYSVDPVVSMGRRLINDA